MNIYIAGKLSSADERERLNSIARLCEMLGFQTFLPHRDVGLFYESKDIDEIFKKDIFGGLNSANLVIALLDGLHVGAGTAWELGYAYAKGIPCVGIKTDESVEEAIEYLSPILASSLQILSSQEDLRKFLINFKKISQSDLSTS